MQTLTDQQFKDKYGESALKTLKSASVEKEQKASLFDSIKNDLSARASNLVGSNDPNYQGVGGAVAGITHNAAQIAGGINDVAGEALTRTPVVGGLFSAAGNALKGGVNAIINKLASTKLFQEAGAGLNAQYDSQQSPLEKGLSFASDAGTIAGTALGVDQGIGLAGKATDAATSISSKIGSAADNIPKPDLGAAGAYFKSSVKDVMGTLQNRIDHNISTALDLTPGDLGKIAAKTGNEVGPWLSKYNLIPDGANKAAVQASVDAFKTQNYNAVRSAIGKVTQTYTPFQIPRFTDALKAIQGQIKGIPGLEKANVTIDNFLNKTDLTLQDVQAVKELLDDHFKLYNALGDVAEQNAKQGLANIRTDLKDFIEKQVKENTGEDIREMNNNVATARSLSDAITTRTPRGVTRNMFNQRDYMMGLGLTYFGSPILGIAAVLLKKIATSPTVRLRVARYLDKLSDTQKLKISQELEQGIVPAEIKDVAGDLTQ